MVSSLYANTIMQLHEYGIGKWTKGMEYSLKRGRGRGREKEREDNLMLKMRTWVLFI